MKYLIFCFALAVGAQSFPPSSSGNARAIHGKPICASVMTATDGQVLAWSTSSACWVASSAGAGVGDVTGAASLSTGGLIAIAGATAGSVATDSGLAFNTTTKAVGIFGPIIGGQNSTYQGKLQLRGLTSGVSTLSADADGSGMTLDGRLTVTELVAGTTGANLFTAITAPATPSAGIGAVYVDSTSKNLAVKDDAGVVKHGVQTKTAASNQVLRAIADDGTVTQSALASGDIPNNAANTSGTAASITGNLTGDVTSTAMATTLAAKHKTRTQSMTVFDPVTGDSGRVQMMFPYAVTVTSISCSVKAATSATINLDERAFATPDTAGTAVLTTALACDTDGATSTTFTNAGLAANVPVALLITAVSGTPDTLRVYVTYSVD